MQPPHPINAVPDTPWTKRFQKHILLGIIVVAIVPVIACPKQQPVAAKVASPASVPDPGTAQQIKDQADKLQQDLARSRKLAMDMNRDGAQAMSDLNSKAAALQGQQNDSGQSFNPLQKTGTTGTATSAQQDPPKDHGFLRIDSSDRDKPAEKVADLISDQRKALEQYLQPREPQPAQAQPTVAAMQQPPQVQTGPQKESSEHDIPEGPRFRLSEGALIPCVLLNRLNGDFSGPVKVATTVDVYDDSRGHILIPKGSILIGETRQVGAQNERRLAVAFHRIEIKMHEAGYYAIDIDKFPGLDQRGETALPGKVNSHLLSALAWSLPIGAASAATYGTASYGFNSNGFDQMRSGIAQSEGQTAQQIFSRKANRLPTITVHEGDRITSWVAADIHLPEYPR